MKYIVTPNGKFIGRQKAWAVLDKPVPSLPPFTLRLKYAEGITPQAWQGTFTLVDAENNIWDWTYNSAIWTAGGFQEENLIEVIDGNMEGVTNANYLFSDCADLVKFKAFNMSTVQKAWCMFSRCAKLQCIPEDLLLPSVKEVNDMFNSCPKVEHGMLAFYNKLKSLGAQITDFSGCFSKCGVDYWGTTYASEQARLERAQIPTTWGGDMEV